MCDLKWSHCQGDVILWVVRVDCRYPISYRDLEEMLAERGISVDHTTIYRWVQCYAPEMEKRLRWFWPRGFDPSRSQEHTSELQSLMRISYAVVCLNKNNLNTTSFRASGRSAASTVGLNGSAPSYDHGRIPHVHPTTNNNHGLLHTH